MKWLKVGEQDLPPIGTKVIILQDGWATDYTEPKIATVFDWGGNGAQDDLDFDPIGMNYTKRYAVIEMPKEGE